MIREVLHFLQAGPARLPEIQRHFGLPPAMAANLVIQLEDAGFIEEAGAGCACQGCGREDCTGCGGKTACSVNPPYRLTAAGEAFLQKSK